MQPEPLMPSFLDERSLKFDAIYLGRVLWKGSRLGAHICEIMPLQPRPPSAMLCM
jgi:hypothetical protein